MTWYAWRSLCVWKFSFFLVIVIVYIFVGLVLQVVNPFLPGGNKRSKFCLQICLRMFNLLLPLSMKGLKTKTNCYISSKYLCISYNDRDTFFHTTIILNHLLKLTKLLVVRIIKKHTSLKIIQCRLLGKCGFKNNLF